MTSRLPRRSRILGLHVRASAERRRQVHGAACSHHKALLVTPPSPPARSQLPKLMELVGLGYSAWFTYRYLLFKVRGDWEQEPVCRSCAGHLASLRHAAAQPVSPAAYSRAVAVC